MMKVCILQFEVVFGNIELNHQRLKEQLNLIEDTDIDLIVLPELWTTGYDLNNIHYYGKKYNESVNLLQKVAQDYDVNLIAGSIAYSEDKNTFNRGIIIDRTGELISHYDKAHLVPMLNEPKYLTEGPSMPSTFQLDDHIMGTVICYDLRFPELFRYLSINGASVIIVVAEWPLSRIDQWKSLLIARAIEQQCFIVGCNTIGIQEDGTQYGGQSMIISPLGKIIAQGSTNYPEQIIETIDVSLIKPLRDDIPVFNSIRRDLY